MQFVVKSLLYTFLCHYWLLCRYLLILSSYTVKWRFRDTVVVAINEANGWVTSCLIVREHLLLLVICSSLFGSVIHSDSDIEMPHGINTNKIGTCTLENCAGSLVANVRFKYLTVDFRSLIFCWTICCINLVLRVKSDFWYVVNNFFWLHELWDCPREQDLGCAFCSCSFIGTDRLSWL